MTHLLMIGFGRPGRFEGFTKIALDKRSFKLAKTLADEWDDDDFNLLYDENCDNPNVISFTALLVAAQVDYWAADEYGNHPKVVAAKDKWTLLKDKKPYENVHVILIWNTNT